MYTEYWQLDRVPFVSQSDPDFYFPSASHQASLLKLRYVIEHARGAAVLLGGSGAGKTYLVSKLAGETTGSGDASRVIASPIVHLLYSRMTAPELLSYLAVELGADEHSLSSSDGSLDRILRGFEQALASHTSQGRHPLLVLDDAHLIEDVRVWQTFQMLMNYQQRPDLSFTMLFIGDRTLAATIHRQAQVDTRITVKTLLQPLTHAETADYVRHRLRVAGCERELFTTPALRSLFELSSGVPQRINRLCDLALLVGYADKLDQIGEQEVEAVAEELTFLLPD